MRILLPFNKGATYASFYTDFHAGIERAVRELGHELLVFGHEDIERSSPAEQQALYRALTQLPCEAVFDLCCWAHCLSLSKVWDGSSTGEPIFDSLEMDYVGLLFDHPWFQPLPAVHSARLYASIPDRSNAAQLALVYPQVKLRGMAFAPPAIDERNDRSGKGVERDLDLLYIGNLHHDALARLWRDAPNAAVFDDTADLALAEPDLPLHVALQRVLSARAQPLDAAIALEVLRPVEYFRRTRFRLDAVRAAAASGVSMLVIGNGWERADLPANVRLGPFVDYRTLLGYAARARICLDASTYPQGANDRVFNYMLNGAVCFTNARGFLGDAYGAGDGLHFYSLTEPQALAGAIRELLAAPQRLRADAVQARELTLATQTWRHRVEAILAMLAADMQSGRA
jgi:hypothetical protein